MDIVRVVVGVYLVGLFFTTLPLCILWVVYAANRDREYVTEITGRIPKSLIWPYSFVGILLRAIKWPYTIVRSIKWYRTGE